jgi:hypothetical protein
MPGLRAQANDGFRPLAEVWMVRSRLIAGTPGCRRRANNRTLAGLRLSLQLCTAREWRVLLVTAFDATSPGRPELHRLWPIQSCIHGYRFALALMILAIGGIIIIGRLHHQDDVVVDIFFLLPIAAQVAALSYVSTVQVQTDGVSFQKSSCFGKTSFPIGAITELSWQGGSDGRSLLIRAGNLAVSCSVSVFGRPQLEDLHTALLARDPKTTERLAEAQRLRPPIVAGQIILSILGFWVLGVLMFMSLASRFVPTQIGSLIIVGGVVTAGAASGLWWLTLMQPWRPPANPKVRRTTGQAWAIALFVSLMIGSSGGLFIWAPLHLIECWYTDLAGSTAMRFVTVTGYSPGGRGCSRIEVAEADPSDNALCASRAYFSRHPAGSKISLTGPTSILGSDIVPLSDAAH